MRILIIVALATLPFAATAFPRTYSYHAPRTNTYKASSRSYGDPVRVRGYFKQSGTYVAPHYQTAPNRTKTDNWSSKPNTNPYTGSVGTKNAYGVGH
jgi:hypothetical protein